MPSRLLIIAAAAFLALPAGCTGVENLHLGPDPGLRLDLEPVEDFEYSGELRIMQGSQEGDQDEMVSGEIAGGRICRLDVRVLILPAETEARILGSDSRIRAGSASWDSVERFLCRVRAQGLGRILSSPRVSGYAGRKMRISIESVISLVGGYSLKACGGGRAADPECMVVRDGMSVAALLYEDAGGAMRMKLDFRTRSISRPVAFIARRLPGGEDFKVAAPLAFSERMSCEVPYEARRTVVLRGLSAGNPDEVLLVFATPRVN